MACLCSRYNARSDCQTLEHYSPVLPTGRLRVGKMQSHKSHNKQLINLELLVFYVQLISIFGLAVLRAKSRFERISRFETSPAVEGESHSKRITFLSSTIASN